MTELRSADRAWPLAVAGSLLAMIAGTLAVWWISLAYPDPLVVEDAWEAEGVLREEAHAVRRASGLGLSLDVDVFGAPDGVRLAARLADRSAAAPAAESVSVRRERPAEGGLDAEIALAERAGVWSGDVPLPRSGRWRLVVRARVPGGVLVERELDVEAPR